jgi:hypothetical protein
MNSSTNMRRRWVNTIAFVVGIIVIVSLVPFAQAKATATEKYGPLDPWAYAVIHRSTQPTAAQSGKYGPLDPWAYAAIHRSRQATLTQSGKNPLDLSTSSVIRLHQAPVASGSTVDRIVDRPPYASPTGGIGLAAPRSVNSDRPNGVDWRDAGIGAAGAFVLMLLAVAVWFAMRKRGILAHSGS